MVHHSVIFFMILFLSRITLAQDERYFRQIFTGELPQTETFSEGFHQFNVEGSRYRLDLDGDKIEEIIQPSNKDGVNWIEIKNSSERILFSQKLFAMGATARLYKIKLVNISKSVKALILFMDEGYTSGRETEMTARISVLSFENNDLTKISFSEGPHFFHEKAGQREQYWRRDYAVNVYDINGDGVREIAVQYNHINRIMMYIGRGEWQRF
jgi:hypothetical protein